MPDTHFVGLRIGVDVLDLWPSLVFEPPFAPDDVSMKRNTSGFPNKRKCAQNLQNDVRTAPFYDRSNSLIVWGTFEVTSPVVSVANHSLLLTTNAIAHIASKVTTDHFQLDNFQCDVGTEQYHFQSEIILCLQRQTSCVYNFLCDNFQCDVGT